MFVRIDRRRKLPASILLRALSFTSEQMLEMFFDTSKFRIGAETCKLELVPSRLRGDIATFDIKDKDGSVVVEEGRRVTARHIRQLEKSGITELEVPTEYLYGQHPGVMTHLDFDAALAKGNVKINEAGIASFIQCIGSRTVERPSCSRVCCTHSLKSAIKLKKINPEMQVIVFYRDIRAYGFREDLFKEARQAGVLFVRFGKDNPPKLSQEGASLFLSAFDPILGRELAMQPDLVVLASAIRPNENRMLVELFKVPVNAEGFLVEAHSKLRPVDFASEGIFMAGLAHYPKSLDESITQAQAAVSRAMIILSKPEILVGGVVASVDAKRCAVCLTCVRVCPYGVPKIKGEGHAEIEPAECHSC